MSRGYRSILAALVGIALLGGFIAFGLNQQSAYADRANAQAADYAKHAANKIKQTCFGLARVEQPKCLRKEAQAYRLDTRDKQREYDDLVAQRTSALWTMIMGIAALIGMALSVVGVALVWTTFRETRAANQIAMDRNFADLRPYLGVYSFGAPMVEIGPDHTWADDPGQCRVRIEGRVHVKNVGSGIASNVTCGLAVLPMEGGEQSDYWFTGVPKAVLPRDEEWFTIIANFAYDEVFKAAPGHFRVILGLSYDFPGHEKTFGIRDYWIVGGPLVKETLQPMRALHDKFGVFEGITQRTATKIDA